MGKKCKEVDQDFIKFDPWAEENIVVCNDENPASFLKVFKTITKKSVMWSWDRNLTAKN